MVSPTPNKGMTYPAHGGAVNAWDSPLNTNFDQLDLNLGGYYPITVTSTATTANYNSTSAILSSTVATAVLPSSLAQNFYYNVTGALTQDLTLTYPAVGSFYAIANNTSGAFTVTAVTAASTSAGTVIPQGSRMGVVSDGTNLLQSDNAAQAAEFYSYFGGPQGNVPGTVATVNGANTDSVWDPTNRRLYVVTTTGSSATAVWSTVTSLPTPQGIITPVASTTAPVPDTDITATTIYYTPLTGNYTLISNGTALSPYVFSQMTLTLTGSLAASTLYDLYLFPDGTNVRFGFGVAWTASGAGVGSRGSGAGTAQIALLNGIWVNAQSQNMTYNTGAGNNVVAVSANQGVYLGSIFIDGVAGQVTCHRSVGQNRKWGIFNTYNRAMINLQMSDPTASWNYNTATIRQSRADTTNTLATFTGLPDQETIIEFTQQILVHGNGNGNASIESQAGIGLNITTAYTGKYGVCGCYDNNATNTEAKSDAYCKYILMPTIGINYLNSLERGCGTSGDTSTFFGNSGAQMLLTARWLG